MSCGAEREILYEQIVDHSVVSAQKLILLSELRRKETHGRYAGLLKELIAALRRPSARLREQPLFQWPEWGLESPCFRFELHRALSKMHDFHSAEAVVRAANGAHAEAEISYMKALQASLEMVKNLTKWTAQHVELKRFPLMHIHYLLSMVAKNKSLLLMCRYNHINSEDWQHGSVTPIVQQALDYAKRASQFALSGALLWQHGGCATADVQALEKRALQAYYRTASLCGSTFQERLDYAHANVQGEEADPKCVEVMELNERLYFLTPNPIDPPEYMNITNILHNEI